MTYTNIVYSLGIDTFIKKIGDMNGMILADLPLRENKPFEKAFKKHGVNIIRFLTPESRDTDIKTAVKDASDFIYFVSKRGTTGGNFALDEETRKKINRARQGGAKVFVGFGIKSKKDAELAFKHADGAIIGTQAVRALESGIENFERFIRSVRA